MPERNVPCAWCGFALRGTKPVLVMVDGRPQLELRLCGTCRDHLATAIAAAEHVSVGPRPAA